MATKIKGTVTRVMPNTGNFFLKPTPDDEVALRSIDVDGHRVGDGEISSTNLSVDRPRPKFKPWTAALPKVGDDVELELVKEPE